MFVMNTEPRAKHVRLQINKQPEGMIDYSETKSQPVSEDKAIGASFRN
jgi:hypothetical protein